MRRETLFTVHDDLILVEGIVTGPRSSTRGRFVLDTGAVMTTLTPNFAEQLGYSARDGIRRTRVRSAIGDEDGYVLSIAGFTALECPRRDLHVHIFDLGDDDIDGLLGLNFLDDLNYEVRSAERRILIEPIERPPPQQ